MRRTQVYRTRLTPPSALPPRTNKFSYKEGEAKKEPALAVQVLKYRPSSYLTPLSALPPRTVHKSSYKEGETKKGPAHGDRMCVVGYSGLSQTKKTNLHKQEIHYLKTGRWHEKRVMRVYDKARELWLHE